MARKLCIEKLSEYLDDEKICERIEKSIYNYSLIKSKERCIPQNIENDFFRRIYVNKLHQIYLHLKPDSGIDNKYFIDRILNEEIDPDKVAFINPQDMHYEHWSVLLERQTAAEQLAENSKLGIVTSEFTCARCKGNKTSYRLIQDRGADESASIHIACLSCKKKWRIRG